MNFSIIIPAGGRVGLLKWCIKYLKENSFNKNHEIIVGFDNLRLYDIEGEETRILNEYGPPSKELVDWLMNQGMNIKTYDLGRLGDHYRVSNACIQHCSNDWIVLTHNDIYHAKDWDLGLMEYIENGTAKEHDILCPNSLFDHAQPAGIDVELASKELTKTMIMTEEYGETIQVPIASQVEDFINKYKKGGFYKERNRSLTWVCPIIIKKQTFIDVGMYPVKFTFPDANDLYLDSNLLKKYNNNRITPLSSFIYHI